MIHECSCARAGRRHSIRRRDAVDWDAPWEPVQLWAELPYWLMVRDCTIQAVEARHAFTVDIVSTFHEFHVDEVTDSKKRCVYVGPVPPRMSRQLASELEESQAVVLSRKCKTILRIHSRCNADVLAASRENDTRRRRDARLYFISLCAAHLPIINRVIQGYRLATYDYFPFELSPWDAPTWLIHTDKGFVRTCLQPYREWDYKPHIGPIDGESHEYELIAPESLVTALDGQSATPGELELLDALTFMERGDYAGAVRRMATALEVLVEDCLRRELSKRFAENEVTERLQASRNDFPGRVRQFEKLSGRQLPDVMRDDVETTRKLRHDIVHRGARISFAEKGHAQRAVDTGRWTFNWFEDLPDRAKVRETHLATRSIGRHIIVSVFNAALTEEGVVVMKPEYLDNDEEAPPSDDAPLEF